MNIDDIFKGYSDEQYSEALHETLVNYLCSKGIIVMKDFREFEDKYSPEILAKIVERDRNKAKEAYEKYKKENSDK